MGTVFKTMGTALGDGASLLTGTAVASLTPASELAATAWEPAGAAVAGAGSCSEAGYCFEKPRTPPESG